ncbi:cobalt-precorrin-6A reductase [Kribbella sp. NPDC055110]
MKVLLLGGTGEARELAGVLAEAGVDVVSSLAGRTSAARVPVGEVRVGGFGGVSGLVDWLREHPVDAVIDATHPFAARMTANAVAAAGLADVPLLHVRRPGWTAGPGDDWHWCDTVEDAAARLPALGSRAFLTIGRQGLDTFAHVGIWMLARCVDPPEPRPAWCELILARGPFALADELGLLRDHEIDVLVTKDSGGSQTAAKLAAARELGLPVLIIHRPPLPAELDTVESVGRAAQWVMQTSRSSST